MSKAKPSKKSGPPPASVSSGGGGGKAKKKKWSKGKTKDKANNVVILEKNLYDRIIKDITHSKVITPSSIVERHHTNCSVARSVLEELSKNGVIRKISGHHLQKIYASIIVEAPKQEVQIEESEASAPVSPE